MHLENSGCRRVSCLWHAFGKSSLSFGKYSEVGWKVSLNSSVMVVKTSYTFKIVWDIFGGKKRSASRSSENWNSINRIGDKIGKMHKKAKQVAGGIFFLKKRKVQN